MRPLIAPDVTSRRVRGWIPGLEVVHSNHGAYFFQSEANPAVLLLDCRQKLPGEAARV